MLGVDDDLCNKNLWNVSYVQTMNDTIVMNEQQNAS